MSEAGCKTGRALVTGATGFIGLALCERLRGMGVAVRGLARTRAVGPWDEFVRADLGRAVPETIVDGVDWVFHLAGKAHALDEMRQDAGAYRRINVEATAGLLDRALAGAARSFVFASSVKVLGEGSEQCLDETTPLAPATAYAETKAEAETLVAAAAARGLHAVNLRLPLVYGPRCKGNLARMLGAVERGRFPPLAHGANRRSMVHVDDVARAAVLAAANRGAAGATYIVTDGRAYSTRELYELMCVALGKRPASWSVPVGPLRILGRMGDLLGRYRGRRVAFDSAALDKLTGSAWYSSRKIEAELGFTPARSLAESLPEMVADLRRAA